MQPLASPKAEFETPAGCLKLRLHAARGMRSTASAAWPRTSRALQYGCSLLRKAEAQAEAKDGEWLMELVAAEAAPATEAAPANGGRAGSGGSAAEAALAKENALHWVPSVQMQLLQYTAAMWASVDHLSRREFPRIGGKLE